MTRGKVAIRDRLIHLDGTSEPHPSVRLVASDDAKNEMWGIIDTLGCDVDYTVMYTADGGIRITFEIGPDGNLK